MTKLHVASAFIITLAITRVGAAGAASIVVDTTADDVAVNGNCTLREAVLAANSDAAVDGCAAGAGTDTIVVPPGTYALILRGFDEDAGAAGDLDVTGDLELAGAAAATTILDGMATDRVLDVHPGAQVSVHDVTIRNGLASSGGGIRNEGTLTLTACVVRLNRGCCTPTVTGGGIASSGALTVSQTIVEENWLGLFGPRPPGVIVISGAGAGIFAGGPVVVRDSIVRLNGVNDDRGLAFAAGGGLAAQAFAIVEGSTVSGNDARAAFSSTGGGIDLGGGGTIRNSTLTDNVAQLGSDAFASASTTLENVTVAGTFGYVAKADAATTFTFRNSIVAACAVSSGSQSGLPVSTVADAYNLTTDRACPFSGTDQVVADLGLDPLADNGGPTPTRALALGSPAREQGSPAEPGSGGNACLAGDQRGAGRPQGARCDVGAVEDGPAPVTTTTTTTTATSTTSTTSTTTTTTMPPLCAPTPRTDCLGAATPHGAALALREKAASPRGRMSWSWRSAAPLVGGDFGAPLATTSLSLCLYDATGLRFRTTGESGSGWSASRTGFDFQRDPSGSLEPDRMSLRARPRRAGHIQVIDRAIGLPVLPLMPPVRVQVGRDDGGPCWEGVITTPGASTTRRFTGRSD